VTREVLLFTAPWCVACGAVHTALAGLPDLREVDVEASPKLAEQHAVKGLPTVVVLRDGNVVWRKTGIVTRAEVEQCGMFS
jgi:thioredoxin 1